MFTRLASDLWLKLKNDHAVNLKIRSVLGNRNQEFRLKNMISEWHSIVRTKISIQSYQNFKDKTHTNFMAMQLHLTDL